MYESVRSGHAPLAAYYAQISRGVKTRIVLDYHSSSKGASNMSTDSNKAVIRRYYEEVLNSGNVDALQDIAVNEYDEHDPLPGQANGREGLRQRVEMLRNALQPHFTLEDVVAEYDTVVVRWINRGALVGPILGLPPNGKSFAIAGIDIHRLRDGKMAEHWHVVDQLTMLQQLGMIPSPSPSGA
jgi:steroid delta-isomerase-like uncharacterized protein